VLEKLPELADSLRRANYRLVGKTWPYRVYVRAAEAGIEPRSR
jgi:hypothetical protein